MTTKRTESKSVAVIEKKVTQIETAAKTLAITDQTTLGQASQLLLLAKQGQTQAIEMFDPQRAAAWESYQIALGQLNKYKTPFINAEKDIKAKIADYHVEQERLREEQERRLQEEAEKKAEKERQKLLKKAGKAKTEEEREELEEEAESVVAYTPTVAPNFSTSEGVSSRLVEKPEITDPMALIKAIASGELKVDIDRFITFKLPVLEQYIKLTGMKKIPGVTIKKTAAVSARR